MFITRQQMRPRSLKRPSLAIADFIGSGRIDRYGRKLPLVSEAEFPSIIRFIKADPQRGREQRRKTISVCRRPQLWLMRRQAAVVFVLQTGLHFFENFTTGRMVSERNQADSWDESDLLGVL